MPTLFEISDDLLALEELLIEAGGEIPNDEAEAALDSFFLEIHTNRDAKLDNYAELITNLEDRASIRRDRARKMAELARADENASARLKLRLAEFFRRHDLKRVDTARHRVTLATNGGVLPLILPEDPAMVPDEFVEFVRKPMAKLIREILEGGQALTFASLGERGQSIRIK